MARKRNSRLRPGTLLELTLERQPVLGSTKSYTLRETKKKFLVLEETSNGVFRLYSPGKNPFFRLYPDATLTGHKTRYFVLDMKPTTSRAKWVKRAERFVRQSNPSSSTSTMARRRQRQENFLVPFAIGAIAGYAIPKVIAGTQLQLTAAGPNSLEWWSAAGDAIIATREDENRWLFEAVVDEEVVSSREYTDKTFNKGVEWATEELNRRKGRSKNPQPRESDLVKALKF